MTGNVAPPVFMSDLRMAAGLLVPCLLRERLEFSDELV